MSWNRRSSVEIVGEILSLNLRSASKTNIMYRVNMSHEQVGMYLSTLEERGHLRRFEEAGRVRYQTTERGQQLLQHIASVVQELGLEPQQDEG